MRDTLRSSSRMSLRGRPLWLAAGLFAGLALAPLPAVTQSEVTLADFEDLARRLETLEARLGGEAAAPAEGGLVVKAPFTVVNEQGQPVFEVEAENTKVEVSVGVGEVGITMETAGQDGAKLEVSGGIDRSLELSAAPALSKLEITQGSSAGVTLGYLAQGETGIEVTAGDDTVFEVKSGAEETSLALGAESGQQAKLESGKEAKLTLGQGEAPAVSLASLAEGGELKLGKGEEASATLSGTGEEGKLELGGGEPAATLSGKAENGTLLLGKENGKQAKLDTEGSGGTLELARGGSPAVTLEAADEGGQLLLGTGGEPSLKLTGKAGGGQIFAGEEDGKRMQLGITDAGEPVVQVADGDKRVALVVGSDLLGTIVTSAEGAAVLGHSDSGWGLHLSKQGTMLAALGTYQQDKLALRLFSNNNATTKLQAEDSGGILTFGIGTQPKVKLTSNDKGGQLEMGDPSGQRVQLGTVGGDSVILAGNGNDRAYLNAGGEQVGLAVATQQGAAEFGKGTSGWGVLLSKQGQPLANLGTLSGTVVALRLYGEGGQIAAVGPGRDGGGTVRVFPAGGGSAMAQMDALGNGGLVGTFLPSGVPVAALDAAEHAVAVYNSSGVAVATLGLGSNGSGGNVTARDGGGTGVFSAGSATDGGGEACVIRQNGNISCLGIGLPGMGTGQ